LTFREKQRNSESSRKREFSAISCVSRKKGQGQKVTIPPQTVITFVRIGELEFILHCASFPVERLVALQSQSQSRKLRESCVWHVLSYVLPNSIEDVLFTIVVEGGMLSSLPELVQPLPQRGLNRESWTIEFSRQRIDTDWYIESRFCNVPHVCNLMA
jgi:hypothetical protein